MKANEIKVGRLYTARISSRFVTVRVDAIRHDSVCQPQDRTYYDVTNLNTGRKTTFRSAAKFKSAYVAKINSDETPDGSRPITGLSTGVNGGLTTQPETKQCSDPTIGKHTSADTAMAPLKSEKTATAQVPSKDDAQAAAVPVLATVPVEGKECSDPTQVTVNPAPVANSIAAKLATLGAPISTGLTAEQVAVLNAAKELEAARASGQRVLVIGAGAGTGKTFTLEQLEQVLRGIGQYTAFDTSLVNKSKAKFTRAACNTTHSLAFRAVGRKYAHRLGGKRVRSNEVARMLGIEDYYVPMPDLDSDGKPKSKRLQASYLAGQVMSATRRFCQSADAEIGNRHLHPIDGVDIVTDGKRDYTNSDKVRAYLLPFAKKAWADLASEKGTLPFAHDVYVKIWQLGTGPDRPVIAADYILLDEAQDTAPVMLDVLRQQKHALLVLVGDDNQQIYEWRGAVNAMTYFPGAPRKLLSQSFRFGQAVADVANAVLAGLDEPTDLVMRGLPTIPTRICAVVEPRCYLFRTNAGAVGRLMKAHAAGKRGHLIGGSKEVVDFCQAALDLQTGRGTTHPELGCFATWKEVVAYSKEDEGQDLRLMVKLIEEFGAEDIRDALRDMPSEENADLILSTAHRSKGREWSSVRLGPDFPISNQMTDADRRLLYVACTRAQEELDITACPTFCGGYDTRDTGNAETYGAWVPGIAIDYTAPMPTEEQLREYRCRPTQGKQAAESDSRNATSAGSSAQRSMSLTKDQTEGAVESPKPSTSASAATGRDEYTWANMDGNWCVRGPKDKVGQRVTVMRKNGSKSSETLQAVTKKIGELWFYTIR